MEFFAQMMAVRQQQHPEAAAVRTVEYRARVLNERVWHSEKLRKVQPPTWIPEYAWLVSIACVDGTFELDAHDIWAKAYACNRSDWTPEQVGKLLDEFERVGLLIRKTDENGKIWGFWTGSDNFQPPPSMKHHFKKGKRSLFGDGKPSATQGADKSYTRSSPGIDQTYTGSNIVEGELELVSESEVEIESDFDFDGAAKSSENKQPQRQEQPKPHSQKRKATSSVPIPTNRLEATPTAKAASAPPSPTRETIGEHFRGDLTIASLSDHNLDNDVTWSAEDREHLNECIGEAVSARAAQPYVDLRTNASLMGDAMKLLLETYEKNVPAPWLPVMQLLRDADAKPRKLKPKPPRKQEANDFHRANGYEQCSDNIWRPAAGREADGYTVKREGGIWWKP
jgi:hypothetical protein